MALQKFNDDLNIIAKLGDNPRTDNGLSTQGFKSKFDEAGLALQSFINDTLIPGIENTAPGLYSVTMGLAAVVLTVSGWSENTQTVSVPGVVANQNAQAVVTAAVPASLKDYQENFIQLTEQGDGTLTFTCEYVPIKSIAVNVLILTKGG